MGKTNNLVIVESPSKAKTIGRYLGPGYTVKASMGHLRDLPKSKMGVDLEHNFTPQYIPVRGKEALIKELKAELEKTEEKPSFESDSDDASVAISEATSEIFTTEQDVLEASPIPLSVSQQLDLAIKSLSSEAHTSPVESAVCTLAVADLQKWKAIIEQGTSHSR